MKIGTFYRHLVHFVYKGAVKNIPEALEMLLPLGLSCVDVPTDFLQEKFRPKFELSELKSAGISVSSVIHAVSFDDMTGSRIAGLKEDTARQLERCAQLESPIFMPVPIVEKTHSSADERCRCRDLLVEYAQDVARQAKKYRITPAFENFSMYSTPFSTLEDITYVLECVPDLGFVLDTGNFWFVHAEAAEAVKLFADRIQHVHVKDILEKENGALLINDRCADSVAIGRGSVPVKEICSLLLAKHYEGVWSIEINDENELLQKLKDSLRFLS